MDRAGPSGAATGSRRRDGRGPAPDRHTTGIPDACRPADQRPGHGTVRPRNGPDRHATRIPDACRPADQRPGLDAVHH
ncbi:hypothetical protein ACFQ7B_34805, partial [Streptomyces erythrochromogenes]|uniref:hypothetical protein n=1 Tax=Streptomyces erythrochromogenes TaxID=285574 RepID=UPI003673E223